MASESLAQVVLNLADDDADLPDRCKHLVMAALDGDGALAIALNAEKLVKPNDFDAGDVSVPTVAAEPVGAFLASIEVAGFRGIGASAKLQLHPAPGLTIVAGRNGSGKSSFAEALELALTGDSYRWANRNAQWTSAWRNLNQSDPCRIRVELAEEEKGRTTVGVDWAADGELDDRNVWTQRPGAKQESGIGSLGWTTALELYRPILSYEELGHLLDAKPVDLYKALERILGLEQLNDATVRLSVALKHAQEPDTEAKARKSELREALEGSDDGRAQTALAQVRKNRPDLDVLSRLAVGTQATVGGTATLRALSQQTLPETDVVETAAHGLRTAAATVATLGATALSLVERRTALLTEAVELHKEHGDMPCPLCGDGTLDEDWRDRVSTQLTNDNEQLDQLRTAQTELTRYRRQVRLLVDNVPPLPSITGIEPATFEPARVAHEHWHRPPDDDTALADHVLTTFAGLRANTDALRVEAETLLQQREDAWEPIARQLGAWVDLKRTALSCETRTKELDQATKWLRANASVLRNQRLAPLASEARKIWAKLRQESNVDLGSITLEGQANRRHVALRAEVDGAQAGALGVMSQGELHALALALFLPRATRPDSPLRFVVLDDPVQAMDPSKIDGFVRVLGDLAEDRQVVVFSHDDRLAQVARRTAENARVIDVTRETGSRVLLRNSLNPALRHVADAKALAKDPYVPAGVKARVIPGICRLALESAARDTFYRRQLNAGQVRTAVEAAWSSATHTRQRLALALHGAADADTSAWRNARTWRTATLTACTTGVHQGLKDDPLNAIEDLQRTVDDVLWGTK